MKKTLIMSALAIALTGCGNDTVNLPEQPQPAWGNSTSVTTKSGHIYGFDANESVYAWLGIPYAEPPVGDLRWQKPMPKAAWDTPLDAFEKGEVCSQSDGDYNPKGSEDCLTLNVWRPKTDATDLPVYIWIHGGGNTGGNSIEHAEYNGARYAEEANVIVMSMNYRIGPMGWLAHPALRTGDKETDSGNFGTLDIVQSLKWVEDNIDVFGGNADNVTIQGQSAGGMNVISMLLSPKATGLFDRGVVISGVNQFYSMEQAETQGQEILLQALVNDGTAADAEAAATHVAGMSNDEIATYLRTKSSPEVFGSLMPSGAGLYKMKALFADGEVIVADGSEAFAKDTQPNKVPVITGTGRDEAALFLYFDPSTAFQPHFNTTENASSDLWKLNSVDDLARDLTANGHPVYAYQFAWGAHKQDGSGGFTLPGGGQVPDIQISGSTHNIDTPFFFGNIDDLLSNPGLSGLIFAPDTRESRVNLSEAIMSYTANFARTGEPGSGVDGSQTEWTAWSNDAGDDKLMVLGIDGDQAELTMTSDEVTLTSVKDNIETASDSEAALIALEAGRFCAEAMVLQDKDPADCGM